MATKACRSISTKYARRSSTTASSPLYLGFDCSTQSLKVSAVDSSLDVVFASSVNFDADLPSYSTSGGVIKEKGGVVTSPTKMWLDALDILLTNMQAERFPFENVRAISGSGQQHGSVYWAKGSARLLGSLDSTQSLAAQLNFAFEKSPVWMDSSTSTQCQHLEMCLGGAFETAKLTGSSAYERFTGPQIAKLAKEQASKFSTCERISLVSSFFASVFAGKYAPIDYSDGSGMNLMDVASRKWAAEALKATLPTGNLESLLGQIAPSHEIVGKISPYFADKFGFASDCRVVAWSGDNPCTVAGLGLTGPGDVAVSLGTSDTVFGITASPKPQLDGHIFASPIDPLASMAMLCFQNGSLAREKIRDRCAGGSWEVFADRLASTAPGNGNRVGIYVFDPEITPRIKKTGIHFFDLGTRDDCPKSIDHLSPEEEVRAVLEGHFLSMRLHSENLGIKRPRRIIVAGGASQNDSIVQVISDVFGVPVLAVRQSDAASLGAAYRALHADRCCDAKSDFVPFNEVIEGKFEYVLRAKHDPSAHAMYTKMLPMLKKCESSLL
eukprot:g950.t1